MSKNYKIVLMLLLVLSVFFVSCSNFYNGAALKQALENQIDYSNAPFAKLRIKYDSEAALTCIPVTGDYNDKYKTGSNIPLSFTPKKRL